MKIFNHHVYEYKKGLRNLILITTDFEKSQTMIDKLNKRKISFISAIVSATRVNIFFGEKLCIDVLRNFTTLNLTNLSDEEDFILGTMLGYCSKKQCFRYLKRKSHYETMKLIN